MRADEIVIYKSPDKRLKTSRYVKNGKGVFCLAEKTSAGALITEFDDKGVILNQRYTKTQDHIKELYLYLDIAGNPDMKEVHLYENVAINAKCTKCGSESLRRELDLSDPERIKDVPVVPIYICLSCKQKFYSMSDHYLRNLVHTSKELFTKEELGEMARDENAFIGVLQEYIIRIFASKKISRLKPG